MNRGPIRVLHLRDSPWVDGPGRTILETAARLDPARVQYHIGAFAVGDQPHQLVQAAEERRLSIHRVPDRRGVSKELLADVVRLVDELRVEVLHTSEFRSNLLGLLCRRQRPLFHVSTAHGWIANDLKGRVYSLADRALLRFMHRVVMVSHATRRRVPGWWLPDRRVRVIHNALMVESYGKADWSAARRVPDPQHDVHLLNVGRLSAEKGQELLLRVIARLKPEFPGLRLSFAGVGPLESRLRTLAGELGIADRVAFLGFVADMPALYREVDLVVQSSFTEGLPNVILEVAFLGVPVVATRVGGTGEVIEHGKSGWLVEPRSRDALAAGLRRYLADPAGFQVLARAGRERIERDFTFEARTEAQTRVYEELTRTGAA